MFAAIAPSLISAGASIFGGLMGQNNASSQFWQNVKMQNRAMRKQSKWNKVSLQFAKSMANRNTIKWRVKDALRSGVHPLYALGANLGSTSSPVFQTGAGGSVGYSGDGGFASGIAQAGQHLGRAVDAMATHEQKAEARMMSLLNVENAGLQNELLRSQIRRMNLGTGPAMPAAGQKYLIDGQGNTVSTGTTDAVTFAQKYPEAKQNVQFGSINQANPYISNAEDVEARHGELADAAWGALTIPADIYWNYLRDRSPHQRPWYSHIYRELFGTREAH